jgi:hypothetical protein
MRYYIVSKNSCQVKINSKIIGTADCNLSSFTANDGDLLELFPLNDTLAPLHTTLFEDGLLKKNLAVYEYKNDFLIIPFFELRPINEYKIIFTEDLEGVSIRVFSDGQIKVFITTEKSSNLFYLPFMPTIFNVKKINDLLFLTIKNKREGKCLIFDISSTPNLMLKASAKDVLFKDLTFTIAKRVNFIRSDILNCEYDYNLTILNKTFEKSKPIASLSHHLIPFAFLEELSEGMPIEEFLLPSLRQHKSLVFDFFGSFATFVPTLKKDACSALLIYQNKAEEVVFNQTEGLVSDFYFT